MSFQVKLRSPIGVFFLALITAGIYYVYWYYRVNEEAAILANDDDAKPMVSVLAITLGAFLIVPFFWSHWATARRVGAATGQPAGIVGQLLLSVLLAPFASLLYTWWVQGKMNKYGRRQRAASHAQSVAPVAV